MRDSISSSTDAVSEVAGALGIMGGAQFIERTPSPARQASRHLSGGHENNELSLQFHGSVMAPLQTRRLSRTRALQVRVIF
ncbi:hypothetical protein [Variovorax sp. SG517]|uniref:hypothetical protein n=1 Tax=Variovorax sp. SG517 TaxID=2587117 RepID=UPI00159E9030|nr:hypothetical protein [Variovorax sp. SG517]